MDEGTDIERSERFADLASSSQGAAVANNASVNYTHGPVHTIRNINIIKYKTVHGDVQKNLDAIQAKIATILKSHNVVRAVYGAQIEKGCMDGTRVQVILEIETWIKDLKGPQIFWLAGMAGTGKSAIAWTVCSRVSKNQDMILAGSFFCSRSTGVSAQRDVRCVVPTLAQLLALQSTKFSEALAAELTANPGVLDQQVGVQVEKLLYKPLLALRDSADPIIFVIDALDECGGHPTNNGTLDDAETHRVVSDMLEALVTFSTSEIKLPVKFFVTSRPETHIRNTHVSDVTLSKVLRLHTVDKQQITADIRLYISRRLLATPTLRAIFTENDVERLVVLCDGLFIVATTALQHALGAGEEFAEAKFKSVLATSLDRLSDGVTAPLDRMYSVIVKYAAKADKVETGKLKELLRVLGALLSARMTLSIAALADLLELPVGHLRVIMTRLHAIINVPDDDNDPSLRPVHASFGDYMFGRAPKRIRISESLGHEVLTHGCFHVLANRLHFNVSQSRSSFESNASTKPNTIGLSLEYACLQWIYQFSSLLESLNPDSSMRTILLSRFASWIGDTPRDLHQTIFDDKIAAIIRPRLLFWLEVMSLLGQVQRAAAMLMFAAATVRKQELAQFLRDANSFVASSQEAIARSAPHIYLSALPFASIDSLVYQDFSPLCSGLVSTNLFRIAHHAGRLVMTLTGHDDIVNSVAYSPDGRLLASASNDGTVRIWDMRTGEEMGSPLRSDDGAVLSVAFAPSIQSIISGTKSGVVCVWSLIAAHVSAQRCVGHSAAVSSVAISPSGSYIASASLDSTVRLWNVETMQQLAVMTGHTDKVHALAFAANGRTLVTGSEDRTIRLWDVEKGRYTKQPPYRHEHAIYSLCFLSDGQIAAGCGNDVILCKPRTGKPHALLYSGSSPIISVSLSSDALSLVSVYRTSLCLTTLPRFRVKTSTVVLDGPPDTTCPITLSPNGLYMTSASDDRNIRIWNTRSSKIDIQPAAAHDPNINKAVSTLSISDSRKLTGHSGDVMSVSVSPDGGFIVSGGRERSVRVWDVQTGAAMLPPLLGHTDMVSSVDVSSDGDLIASGSCDKTVRIWGARAGGAVGEPLMGHTDHVRVVVFSTGARWLASGSDDGTVRIWDVTARRPAVVGPLRCNSSVYALAFSPDGRQIAAGNEKGYINIWQSETGQPVRWPLKTSLSYVWSICFSPDGAHIVSGGRANESEHVQIWSVTGERLLALKGQTATVWSVAYSRDGRFIGTGSEDGIVRLWDAETGARIAVLTGHSDWVQSVAFTPNGQSIVSGSRDRTICVWNITEAYRERSASGGDPSTELHFVSLHDGWLQAPSGELMLWVPPDYRQYLRWLKDGQRVDIMIGKSGWHRGKSWTSCWRVTGSNTTSRPA